MSAPRSETPTTASEALERLAMLAAEAGAWELAEEARALHERAVEGRFHVAIVGQFKRGKSTLIDALVGDPVLPTGIVPVTAVPIVVRHGARRSARVCDRRGVWRDISPNDIRGFVTEEENPENEKGIGGVEVFEPNALLASGLCLVDTPGLGSTFVRSSASTRDLVPQFDAAIIVIGADPPLTADELDLAERISREVSEVAVVLNKADRVSDTERAAATAFAKAALERRLRRSVGRILEVSAKERLDGAGPLRDWDALVALLDGLARRAGSAVVVPASERGVRRLAARLQAVVGEQRAALVRPIDASARRIRALTAIVTDAERSLDDLAHLLAGEAQRLSQIFAGRRNAFLARERDSSHWELESMGPLGTRWGPSARRVAMARAQEVARRCLLPWLEREQREAENAFRQMTERYQALATEFLGRVASSSASDLAHLPRATDDGASFAPPSRFYFADLTESARPASPTRHLADILLCVAGASRVISRHAGRFLDRLLETNSARVESDLNDRAWQSRQRLEASVRALLREALASATEALEHARATQAKGAREVESELSRLACLEHESSAVAASASRPGAQRDG